MSRVCLCGYLFETERAVVAGFLPAGLLRPIEGKLYLRSAIVLRARASACADRGGRAGRRRQRKRRPPAKVDGQRNCIIGKSSAKREGSAGGWPAQGEGARGAPSWVARSIPATRPLRPGSASERARPAEKDNGAGTPPSFLLPSRAGVDARRFGPSRRSERLGRTKSARSPAVFEEPCRLD